MDNVTQPTAATVVETKARQLNVTKLALAEYKRAVHFAEPAEGVSAKDMLDPAYWANVSAKLRPLDRIEAVAADGSWYAEFIVLNCGRLWAKVEILREVKLDANAETSASDSGYDIVWRNPHHKYGVVRKADNVVIKEDFATKTEAARFLQEHLQTLAR